MSYNVGDVVTVYFAYEDENGKTHIKRRPAIVYKVHQETSHALIQITSKNRSGQKSGYWITKNSSEGREMGIDQDSFINLEETYWVPNRFIIRLIGRFKDMDKINEAMKNLQLKVKKQIDTD